MALDKSFVVRQGLEVATDLFYTNLTTRRVGIGSTFPSTTLDVNGGIGATDLKVAGFATIMHDVQVGASGSVFYVSDSSNNVGIGTSIPVYALDVVTPVSTGQTGLHVKGDALFSGIINAESISVSGVTSFSDLTVDNSLVVTGTGATTTTLNVTGVSTFADDISFGSTATFGDNDKLKFGDGEDLEIYHDGSHSYIDDAGTGNLFLRSGTLSVQNLAGSKTSAVFQSGSSQELYHNNSKKFETTGYGVTVTGIVSATSYYGDGSTLSGLVTSITAGDFISVDSSTGNVTITGLANTANVSADTLVVTGVSTLGVVTGATYYGDGSNLTGLVTSITAGDFISVDSSTGNVTITGLANTANVRADTLVVTGVSTLGIVTGVTSIEATTYYGDGSNLTGVSTANVRTDTLVVSGVSTLGVVTGVTAIEATTYYGDGSNLTGLTHSQVSGAMGNLSDDTTPQLGGNLDVNNKDITGTGNVNLSGVITATTFVGAFTGTATDASKISVADESSDTSCFPLFAKSATGIISAFSGSNLTFNSSNGTLSASSFSGDGSNVTNVDADTVDTLHASSFLRSDAASTASGNISFTSTTTPITTNAVKFNNTENDGNYYTDASGVLAFDENFYSDTNYGTGTYAPATVFTGSNGGGILIKNEDGWGAVFTSQNSRYATAEWDGLTVDGNRVLTVADEGSGNNMDADSVDGIHASSFLRSDADDSFTGTITGTTDLSANPILIMDGGGPNIIRFLDNGSATLGIDLVFRTTPNTLGFEKSTNGTKLWETDCDTGVTNFHFTPTVSGNNILTTANEGSGNGLDADTVDGLQASSFLRSDANTTKTAGQLLLNDSIPIRFGTGADAQLFHNGSDMYFDFQVAGDNWYFRDSSDSAIFAFTESTGNFSLYKGSVLVGDGGDQSTVQIKKADNNVSDHIQFYNGTTRVGEIGVEDTTWLRINQETAKNIYTPRYIRADGGFFVDGATKGINGSGNFVGGTIAGASDYGTLLRSDASDTYDGSVSGRYLSFSCVAGRTFNSTSGNLSPLQVYQPTTGTDAAMTFHVASDYAGYFGLDGTTNDLFWGGWSRGAAKYKIWHAANDGSGSGLDADTLDGEQLSDSATANTVVSRNGSADISCRLLRPNYGNQSTISGAIAYRVNNSTDNYVRFCSDTSAIRTFLGAAPSASPTFTGNLTIPGAILHAGDTNTYIQFHGNDLFRVVIAGAEVQEWGNNYTLLSDNDTLRLGSSSDFRMWFNGADTVFRNYAHANGDIIFQGENSAGTNQNIAIMKCDSTANYIILYQNNSEKLRTVSAGVNITGALTATGDVTAFSDITLKEDIEVIPDALDKVSKIRGVTFTRKDLDDKSRKSGVIAQEVEKVLPEVVQTNEEGIKTVAYGNLVGLLVESIKELKAEVAVLKEKCK